MVRQHKIIFASWLLLAAALCSVQSVSRAEVPVPDRELTLPVVPYEYAQPQLPKHLRDVVKHFDNTPPNNPITDHGATLGRVLFYDIKLSANEKVSCASCHKQEFAFTDDRKLSIGFDGKEVTRNSMSLVNVRFYPRRRMFWDERAESLEAQVLMPIENEVEMGHDLNELVPLLQQDPLYPPLFKKAFGTAEVTSERISLALSQFVRAIVSYRSKYDVGRAQVVRATDPFPNFTEQENYGKEQFFGRANCASCHLDEAKTSAGKVEQSAIFYVAKPVANGVDSKEPGDDAGLAAYTKRATDHGKFKVPSLRNIELTAPYMHDGRFHTLDQVVEHYNWSVRPHPNLDERLQDFAANGMALPEKEKVALTTFLLTLTDRVLLKDKRFASPFVAKRNSIQTSQSRD